MADFLSSLFSALPSIIGNLSGSADPYRQQQEALAQQQARYSSAAANPNDPLYKSTYGQYDQQNKNNIASVIAEAQRQNRSQSRMGRQPLFAPERGSENIFRSLMQGYQDSGVQADTQTRSALQSAAGIGQQAAQQYATASPMTAIGNYQKQILGPQGITNLFNSSGQQSPNSAFGPGWYPTQQAAAQNNPRGITWNQQPSYNSWSY